MNTGYDNFYDYDSQSMICVKCDLPLQPGQVTLEYLGSSFPVQLPVCPKCKHIYNHAQYPGS